jgi:SAM-dependent methyltransferase
MTTSASKPRLARLADLARAARTLFLFLLGPADWAQRRIRGRGRLPPLWLRRHVGPVGRFESAAREMTATLDRLALVRPGDLAVDLGCGCGAMAAALGERVGEAGRYVGVDVHAASIRWCRRRWASDPRFRFEHVAPEAGRLPVADGAAGLVLAKSLFTHLLEPETRAYLAEIRRVLAPGRRALLTAFLFAGDREPAAFPHPRRGGASVRWRLASRPRAAVAYERGRFEELVAAAGLTLTAVVVGFWPGSDRPPRGQDVLVVERPAEV